MAKVKVSLLVTILFFCSTQLIHAARPEPAFGDGSLTKNQHEGIGEDQHAEVVQENCEDGEEECLMRRTLAAHIDYIYTQKHKP